ARVGARARRDAGECSRQPTGGQSPRESHRLGLAVDAIGAARFAREISLWNVPGGIPLSLFVSLLSLLYQPAVSLRQRTVWPLWVELRGLHGKCLRSGRIRDSRTPRRAAAAARQRRRPAAPRR